MTPVVAPDLTDVNFDLIMVTEGLDVTACCRRGCPNPAKWSYVHECGETWLLCQRHRVEDDRELGEDAAKGWPVVCGVCYGGIPIPVPWLPL